MSDLVRFLVNVSPPFVMAAKAATQAWFRCGGTEFWARALQWFVSAVRERGWTVPWVAAYAAMTEVYGSNSVGQRREAMS
jgi:hypothetical protein